MTRRHGILALALAAAVILAFLPVREQEEDIVAPARHLQVGRQPAAPLAPRTAKPVFPKVAATDLFPAQSFRPPPPPPPKLTPVAPPPPTAPPLPFGFVGIWTENDKETVFLTMGDRVLSTGKGQSPVNGWRLDDVQPGSLVFTYEPLNLQKTLRISP